MNIIIFPNQTSFIPVRNIHENIVVVQEMLHSMNNLKVKKSFFVIKIDFAKTYDMINWIFMQYVLVEVGIDEGDYNACYHSSQDESVLEW